MKVFKHDFWAATTLYACAGSVPDCENVTVKFVRQRGLCGLPLKWAGRFLRRREESIYSYLHDTPGVPRWVGRVGNNAYAIEYIEGRTLDHEVPPAGFFERLRKVLEAIHNRGVAYCDANKRSNILVGPGGRPFIVDYQIAIRRRDDLPWPLRSAIAAVVRYMSGKDLYHLYKHKRRISPDELTAQEEALSRQRDVLHAVHRKIGKLYRKVRRR